MAALGLTGCGTTKVTVNPGTLDLGYAWIGQKSGSAPATWTNTASKTVTLTMPKLAPVSTFYYTGNPIFNDTLGPLDKAWASFLAIPREAGPATLEVVPTNLQSVNVDPVLLKVVGLSRLEKGGVTLGGGFIYSLPPTPADAIGPTGGPNNGPLDFKTIPVGMHREKTIAFENSTANALTLNVFWQPWAWPIITTTPFTASLTTGGKPLTTITIPAHDSYTLIVSFWPKQAGTYDANLFVMDAPNLNQTANAANLAAISVRGAAVAGD